MYPGTRLACRLVVFRVKNSRLRSFFLNRINLDLSGRTEKVFFLHSYLRVLINNLVVEGFYFVALYLDKWLNYAGLKQTEEQHCGQYGFFWLPSLEGTNF